VAVGSKIHHGVDMIGTNVADREVPRRRCAGESGQVGDAPGGAAAREGYLINVAERVFSTIHHGVHVVGTNVADRRYPYPTRPRAGKSGQVGDAPGGAAQWERYLMNVAVATMIYHGVDIIGTNVAERVPPRRRCAGKSGQVGDAPGGATQWERYLMNVEIGSKIHHGVDMIGTNVAERVQLRRRCAGKWGLGSNGTVMERVP
jgi:hypothetical protein